MSSWCNRNPPCWVMICAYACRYLHAHAQNYTHNYIHVYTDTHTHIYMYIYTYTHIYTHIYDISDVYIYDMCTDIHPSWKYFEVHSLFTNLWPQALAGQVDDGQVGLGLGGSELLASLEATPGDIRATPGDLGRTGERAARLVPWGQPERWTARFWCAKKNSILWIN